MLATNHWAILVSSLFTLENKQCTFLWVQRDLYCLQTILDQGDLKQFRDHWHIKEKRGVLMLSLDKLHTSHVLNWVFLWVLFHCFLFKRKRFMQLWLLPLIPYNSSFLSSIVWSTILKAFEKSINTPSVYKLLSKAWNIWSKNWIFAWSVEWPNWKPNYLG